MGKLSALFLGITDDSMVYSPVLFLVGRNRLTSFSPEAYCLIASTLSLTVNCQHLVSPPWDHIISTEIRKLNFNAASSLLSPVCRGHLTQSFSTFWCLSHQCLGRGSIFCTTLWGMVRVVSKLPYNGFIPASCFPVGLLPPLQPLSIPTFWPQWYRSGVSKGFQWTVGEQIPYTLGGPVVKNPPTIQQAQETQHGFNPWVRKIPLEEEMATTPVFLPRKSHGQMSLGITKESDMIKN